MKQKNYEKRPLSGKKESKLPKWITDHFKDSLHSLELLMQISDISARGISVVRGMPKIIEVLTEVEGSKQNPSSIVKLHHARKSAELANTEFEKDFPVLNGFVVVALWSWLEHFVKGFVALWIRHRRVALEVPAVLKLRVKLGEYLLLSKAEQAEFLVELLEQDLSSALKRGITRFESLLNPFGLSFQFSEKNSKNIFELQQVRNVIAHRNSHADKRICAECPWLKLKINQPVLVSSKMVRNYADSSAGFLLALLYQVGDLYGVNLRSEESEIISLENVQEER
ncbi:MULTISPECIES: hypothetical protein [Comamonas]|uniref:hypothetical protein n=1 Tax=Comamonas TaxID=283 RepID=UPI002580CEFE|nr:MULTISPECIES: hypothetical protein [Comamonas]